MSKVIIIGAFDRYNYGDNLMPILFELFLKGSYPDFFDKYHLIFSALTNSDLSKYQAKTSIAMSEVFNGENADIKAVISIGGEVLCASSSTLFLHMNHSERLTKCIKFLKRNKLSLLADLICKRFYKLPWEYPYIPEKLSSNIKVGFNTVGGGVPRKALGTYMHFVRARLSKADYISVRDTRTKHALRSICSADIYPDSAITMSHFVNDEFIANQSSMEVKDLRNQRYICFQAAPKKIGASVYECTKMLDALSTRHDLKVILCPIGYASGHNDIDFLKEIFEASDGKFILLDELNIWEIMSIIRYSKVFMGTSLHGVITALSFSIPYIGINRSIRKLDGFIENWGIEPSKRCYSINEIPSVFNSIVNIDKDDFRNHSQALIKLAIKNNHNLVHAMGLDD